MAIEERADDVCLLANEFGPLGLQRQRQRGAGHRSADTFASTITGPRTSSRSKPAAVAYARRSSYSWRTSWCSGDSGSFQVP